MKKLRFHKWYALLTLALFAVEVYIGMYVRDAIIRPHGGDYLVVMLVYCFVMTFLRVDKTWAAVGVLLFSYLIEVLQYFQIADLLGLHNSIARTVVGTTFQWLDIVSYTLGVITILLIERFTVERRKTR